MCKKHLLSQVMVARAFSPNTALWVQGQLLHREISKIKNKSKKKTKREKTLYWFVQENVILGFFLKVLNS